MNPLRSTQVDNFFSPLLSVIHESASPSHPYPSHEVDERTHLHPPSHPRLDRRPNQQPSRRKNKNEHDRLILPRVPLETGRKHILHTRVLADRQVVVETELPVAVIAIAGTVFFPVVCFVFFSFSLPWSCGRRWCGGRCWR